jgi:hypothetical protein
LNIVFNDIIFGDMHKHLLVKYLVKIWYKLQRGPINQDGGSTSITHGSQNWNRVQWLSFCLLRQSHTVGSSKPLPPKLFVGQKTLTTQFKKEKENPHHPHVTKTLTPPATPSGPHSHLHKLLRDSAWHRLLPRQPLSSTPVAAAWLPANPTAFRHFRLPPPITIDFLDAARGRPSSARLGNPPYWGFFLMDNKVTNLITQPKSPWIHFYSSWFEDFLSFIECTVHGHIMTLRPRPDIRGVQSHRTRWLEDARSMFNLTLRWLARPTFLNIYYKLLHLDKRCHMQHIRQRGFFSSSFYIGKINDVLFFRLLSYFHDIMVTLSV